jgi:hypothetical protein
MALPNLQQGRPQLVDPGRNTPVRLNAIRSGVLHLEEIGNLFELVRDIDVLHSSDLSEISLRVYLKSAMQLGCHLDRELPGRVWWHMFRRKDRSRIRACESAAVSLRGFEQDFIESASRGDLEKIRSMKLKGFGAKKEEITRRGTDLWAPSRQRLLLGELRKMALIARLEAAASLRRKETAGDPDVLAVIPPELWEDRGKIEAAIDGRRSRSAPKGTFSPAVNSLSSWQPCTRCSAKARTS